jgi:hypothetical protein
LLIAFRAKFHLGEKALTIIQSKGLTTIRQHAFDLINKLMAPAALLRDEVFQVRQY